ncbi:hypothetical protein SPHINGOAX6_70382 [Sphingomonas sp. AX6]|nr:hypothetical protein SPHINGOAX6_70382 [Sphingomonas sp. AX6]
MKKDGPFLAGYIKASDTGADVSEGVNFLAPIFDSKKID